MSIYVHICVIGTPIILEDYRYIYNRKKIYYIYMYNICNRKKIYYIYITYVTEKKIYALN